ncbi:MAG: hypothetical protein P1R58_09990 [bacterium]|nr:hypothetical protein [bacterium]
MSYVPTGAIIAAAAAKKRREQEEEKTAQYKSDDLDGWEFKIVRAYSRKFRSAEQIEQVRQEEAQSGWEMVEKFDDYRLRFKRRVERRSMDTHAQTNPYRTTVGGGPGLAVALAVGLAVLGALAAIFFAEGGSVEVTQPWTLITVLGIAVLAVAAIAAKKRS